MEKLVYIPRGKTLPLGPAKRRPERARVHVEPALIVDLPWGVSLRFSLSELRDGPETLEELLSDLEALNVDVKALRRDIARTPFRAFLRKA